MKLLDTVLFSTCNCTRNIGGRDVGGVVTTLAKACEQVRGFWEEGVVVEEELRRFLFLQYSVTHLSRFTSTCLRLFPSLPSSREGRACSRRLRSRKYSTQ